MSGLTVPRVPSGIMRRLPAVEEAVRNEANGKYILVDGAPDQINPTPFTTAGASVSFDTAVHRNGYGSLKLEITTAATHQLRWLNGSRPTFATKIDPSSTASYETVPFDHSPMVGVWFYIPDQASLDNLTSVVISLFQPDSNSWSRSTAAAGQPPLKVGWNLYRWPPADSNDHSWNLESPVINGVNIIPTTTGACDIYIDSVFLERRPKASIVFVVDASVRWFLAGTDASGTPTGGARQVHSRGWPISWATQPGTWDTGANRITKEEIRELAARGDEITFHSWAGEGDSVSGTLSADETIAYMRKAIRGIKDAGVPFFPWRGAILQNTSAALASDPDLFDGILYAYPPGAGIVGHDSFPPRDRRRLRRNSLFAQTDAQINTLMTNAEKYRSFTIQYVHYVTPDGDSNNVSVARWEQWLSLATAGVRDGWLEFVTMEQLFRRHGGRYISGEGGAYWEWRDASGDIQQVPA